jgi:hypothetical protein
MRERLIIRNIIPPMMESETVLGSGAGTMNRSADEKL